MAHLDISLNAGNTADQNTAFKQFAWDKLDEENRPATVADVTETQIQDTIVSCIKEYISRSERNLAKRNATITF